MNERPLFFNPHQPQTLQVAVMLLYINAAFALLGGAFASLLGLALLVGMGLGGFGVANERKWGYALATGAAAVNVGLLLAIAGSAVLGFPLILSLVFDGALVALLVHPESRDYQRIWFK